MAAYIGKIEAFDETIEPWSSYVERLEQYFKANKVDDSLKVASLLSLIGGKTYNLLRTLTSPIKPAEKSYQEIIKLLGDHLPPKPSIAERFRFHKRKQLEGESINDYVAVLRKLAEHCDFGDRLADDLRDRLVCGMRHENIQKKLLSEAGLTLKKVIEISVAMETAAKDAVELRNSYSETPVHKLHARRKPQPRQKKLSTPKCYRCDGQGHYANECRFKEAICHKCNKKGHIKKVCKGKKISDTRKLHLLGDNEDDESDSYGIYSVSKKAKDAIVIKLCVEKVNIPMELDTGSAVSVISHVDYRKYFPTLQLDSTSVTLKTYSGEKMIPEGVMHVNVQYNNQSSNLDLYVVRKGGPPLFGREWLHHFQLNWKEIKSLKISQETESSNSKIVKVAEEYEKSNPKLHKLLVKYKDLFRNGIGCLTQKKRHYL
jgi:hypothetical protein